MSYQNYQENLGTCQYCGANNIRSQRTGKVYCSAKCWLKNQPQQSYSGQVARDHQRTEPYEKVIDYKNEKISQMVDRKELAIAVMNAKAGAAGIVEAMIKANELKSSDWFIKYSEICQKIYNYTPEKEYPIAY